MFTMPCICMCTLCMLVWVSSPAILSAQDLVLYISKPQENSIVIIVDIDFIEKL